MADFCEPQKSSWQPYPFPTLPMKLDLTWSYVPAQQLGDGDDSEGEVPVTLALRT